MERSGMKRRDFIGMVAGTGASLAAAPAAFAQEPKLTGRVTAAGKAMPSVAVSNGADVTLTDAGGAFELPRHGADKFV
ncbi:MAG: twin-arginine translocation signal domain-containing protein, partial [Kiritimatiellae bacterium]|nr:twin-arginine translocation signal domain-containing protein [Kiritimatiellia bacterium]